MKPVEPNKASLEVQPVGPGSPGWRLSGPRLGLMAGLGVLTVALLLSLGDGQAALQSLAHLDWRPLGLALLVHYSGFAVRGLRWQRLLGLLGHRLGLGRVLGLLISGWFVSALMPARAGDLFRMVMLRMPSQGYAAVPMADGASSIVLERLLDLMAILLLALGFGLAVLQGKLPPWVTAAYLLAGAVSLGVLVTAAVAPHLFRRLGERWPAQPGSSRLWARGRAGLDFLSQAMEGLDLLRRRPVAAVGLVLQSLYIWLCDALLLWLAVRSLGHTLPWGSAAFVALTVDIFAALPITPGGVGQIETAYAALFALLPLPPFNIPAAILVTRAVSYWSFLLFSGLVTFSLGFGQLLLGRSPTPPSSADESAGPSATTAGPC